jgi:putative selenium metabolism hydrolase
MVLMSAISWDPVELAASFVQIPGTSGGEEEMAEAVEAAMRQLGYRSVVRDRFGSVIGVAGPAGPPSLLFDGHMDVVPAVGDWTVDPFGAEFRGGRLYGRGTADMKGALAAAVCGVAKASARDEIDRPVAVSATVLEETIEGVALGAVLDELEPEAVVICEPSSLAIQIGQRGRAEIIVSARGTPAHSATPERGRNPILLGARALDAMERLPLPMDRWLGKGLMVPTDIVSDPYPSISLIPAEVRIRFDRRTVVGEEAAGVLGVVQATLELAEPGVFSAAISEDEVMTYTGTKVSARRWLAPWLMKESHPLVRAAKQAVILAGLDAHIGAYSFCTNGSESAGARAIPTIGFGPGDAGMAHVVDESVPIDEITNAAEVYRQLSIVYTRRETT